MQTSSNSKTPQTQPTLLVACLCADWCGACREYQPKFEQLQDTFPGVLFVWVDVEDESDLVDPIEVENFPTLLLTTRERVYFFGTVMPHVETLQRLIETQLAPGAPAQAHEPTHAALAKRLWGRTA
ncbi:MAG: thioredoxin family protein [Pseudomonadota bacterium]